MCIVRKLDYYIFLINYTFIVWIYMKSKMFSKHAGSLISYPIYVKRKWKTCLMQNAAFGTGPLM